ncbi:hypothetical protein F5Y16DRAFT_243765 [Xylariaceae sp. FL0255]|nr:hypothetical protein F5Y16DRAFT_243765 [Xylariaceae sp. FL0255]
MASQPPRFENLQAEILDIISIPTITSYGRALFLIDEATAAASRKANDHKAKVFLHFCEATREHCADQVSRLRCEADAIEKRLYVSRPSSRASGESSPQRKRGTSLEAEQPRDGVIFQVDGGDHVAGALESLQLENFMLQEENRPSKKSVHWADSV